MVNYIIKKTEEYNFNKKYSEQISLTVKRIQKLLYFSQVEYIKHTGKIMFEDDFYAWPSGPVIFGVYDLYMNYNDERILPIQISDNVLVKEKRDIIDCILQCTNEVDTFDLVECSRTIDNLWRNAYDSDDKKHNQVISKNSLLDYYRNNKNDSMSTKIKILTDRKKY